MAHHHAPPTGFHGPRCWVLSALVGAVLGFLISLVLPPPAPDAHDDGPEAPSTRVFEKLPNGSAYERLPSGAAVPLPPDAEISHTLPVPQPSRADSHAPGPEAEHSAAAHADTDHHAPAPALSPLLIIPFAVMLLSIAMMPFISERVWAVHYPDFAFFLGALMLTYYLAALGAYGREQMLHVALEYYAFIALIGGLFVASGGILIDVRGRPSPALNTALLGFGAVIANIVGTTGASVLLIRPFMRLNRGRLRPIHVILFIFIVSNCGGCLTPIGDPPLYLGFLRGVDFFWTLRHLWPMWLTCVGLVLAIFFIIDSRIGPAPRDPAHDLVLNGGETPAPAGSDASERFSISVRGVTAMVALALIVAGVFIDPILGPRLGLAGVPIGPTFQILVAATAWRLAPREIHDANSFNFHPVKEVGFLFIGIFLTMAPALAYLQAHGAELGLRTPTQYYFATGSLSACLDNAPTYLNFLQAAFGMLHLPLDPEGIERFTQATYLITSPGAEAGFSLHGGTLLAAISLAAVFFGAMTYIGNGPNFMVKAIAESAGLKMPSFFGYLVLALAILLPVLVLVWAVFLT